MNSSRPAFLSTLFCSLSLIAALPAFALTVTSSTHPALVSRDFSNEVGFAPYQRDNGVPSGARFTIEDGALTITNAYAGSFGVDTKVPAFDAEKYGHVFFDYLIPPTADANKTVKVNIFFRVKGSYHGVQFTGPPEVRAGSVFLGTLEGVEADGKWHRAHIPLRDWLRRLYPRDAQLPVEEIIIGNWDNENYLMAGIGGNGTGATWKIDNFVVTGVGPDQAKFDIKSATGAALTQPGDYQWRLDGGPLSTLATPQLDLSVGEGVHVLQLLDREKKVVADYGFFVAGSAPRVGTPSLQNNRLQIPIETKSGLRLQDLKLTVGGKSFETDSPYLRWDGGTGILSLAAAAAGLHWTDGTAVPLALSGVTDQLNRSAPPWQGNVTLSYGAQQGAVALPVLAQLRGLGQGTFEESLDEWAPKEGAGAAIVERDSSTAAAGKYAVRLTSSANASTMGAWVRRTPLDAVKFPVIEFDYKIPPDVRVDFELRLDGQTYSIGFTDRTPQFTRIGQIENVKADNQWHRARIDLLAWLRKARPASSSHVVETLALSDSGYLGNARGLQMWIDNFLIMPVVKGTPFSTPVALADVTGLKALSWVVDEKADTQPPATPTGSGSALEIQGQGRRWLHVRAQNGAGRWSETAHYPVAFDTAPPQVGAPTPAAGAKSGTSRLTISVTDDTGLDTGELKLTLQGRDYTLSNPAFTYNEASGRMALDLENLVRQGLQPSLDEGSEVLWKLAGIKDAAGRTVPDVSGNWKYELASDKTLPSVNVDAPTRSAVWHLDFENGLGPVAPINAKPEVVEDKTLAGGRANKVLRLKPQAVGQQMAVRLTQRAVNINSQSLLGFHYKIPPRAKLALRVQAGRDTYHVKMVGDAPKPIGEIPGIVADDKWHWAQFDLRQLAGKIRGNNVSNLMLVDHTATTPTDVAVELDNIVLQPAGTGALRLNWKATDLSGIVKYRFAWDQNSSTAPTQETTEITRNVEGTAGLWWAHVQAQDKAGNWSEIIHYPVIVP